MPPAMILGGWAARLPQYPPVPSLFGADAMRDAAVYSPLEGICEMSTILTRTAGHVIQKAVDGKRIRRRVVVSPGGGVPRRGEDGR